MMMMMMMINNNNFISVPVALAEVPLPIEPCRKHENSLLALSSVRWMVDIFRSILNEFSGPAAVRLDILQGKHYLPPPQAFTGEKTKLDRVAGNECGKEKNMII